MPTEVDETVTTVSTDAIQADGVTKEFVVPGRETVVALEDVTLTAQRGHVTVLLGPSGCGKSTLLNLFAGLDSPTRGTVSFPGTERRRGDIATMFQRASLLAWRKALENVLLPAEILDLPVDESRQRGMDLLDLVGLSGWHDRYPRELSGGMQQRVALARTLLSDPDVLLLDEPFGALDEMTREVLDIEMCRIVETSDKTVVMVTHSVYEAVLVADEIHVLSAHPGRLATTVHVDLERPRSPDQSGLDRFADTVAEVRAALHGTHDRGNL